MNAFTNTHRDVWDGDSPDACIRVSGHLDGVTLRTPDLNSEEHFSAFDIEISADTATELGHALIAAAKDSKDFAHRLEQHK